MLIDLLGGWWSITTPPLAIGWGVGAKDQLRVWEERVKKKFLASCSEGVRAPSCSVREVCETGYEPVCASMEPATL